MFKILLLLFCCGYAFVLFAISLYGLRDCQKNIRTYLVQLSRPHKFEPLRLTAISLLLAAVMFCIATYFAVAAYGAYCHYHKH